MQKFHFASLHFLQTSMANYATSHARVCYHRDGACQMKLQMN